MESRSICNFTIEHKLSNIERVWIDLLVIHQILPSSAHQSVNYGLCSCGICTRFLARISGKGSVLARPLAKGIVPFGLLICSL